MSQFTDQMASYEYNSPDAKVIEGEYDLVKASDRQAVIDAVERAAKTQTLTRVTWTEILSAYRLNATFKSAVNEVARQISTAEWRTNQERDLDFLNDPNSEDTYESFMTKSLISLLLYDCVIWEVVKSLNNRLLEIVPLERSTMTPSFDSYGRITEWTQTTSGIFGNKIEEKSGRKIPRSITFEPDEIIYFSLYPSIDRPLGNPILDAIINEVAAELDAQKNLADSVSGGDVPEGVVLVPDANENTRKRIKEHLVEPGPFKVVSGLREDDFHWIEMGSGSRRRESDKQLAEIIENKIYTLFGLFPVEMGASVGQGTGVAQLRFRETRLFRPITRLFAQVINLEVLKRNSFYFVKTREEDRWRESRTHSNYTDIGVYSINEVRKLLGEMPLASKLAESHTIKLGNRLILVETGEELASTEAAKDIDAPMVRLLGEG